MWSELREIESLVTSTRGFPGAAYFQCSYATQWYPLLAPHLGPQSYLARKIWGLTQFNQNYQSMRGLIATEAERSEPRSQIFLVTYIGFFLMP